MPINKDFLIRNIQPDDLETISQIELESSLNPWNLPILTSTLKEKSTIALLTQSVDNQIISYLFCKHVLDEIEIENITTNNNFCRQGYASKLLNYLIQKGIQLKVKNFFLEVRYSNKKAISLYKKTGFKESGIRKKYYQNGEDAILMKLSPT